MANAPTDQSRQGRDYLNMSAMGDTCKDVKRSGDEQLHTYEVLNDVPKGTATHHNNNEDTRANKENVWLKSDVTVSRWMIILAVLLFTALISALTGLAVYHVTTSKMANGDALPPQDQDALASLKAEFQAYKANSSQQFVEAQRQISSMSSRITETEANSTKGIQQPYWSYWLVCSYVSVISGLGSTYVRWGRNVCPGNAELVYKGYIGGKRYNTGGSGSDSVCLPYDPTWLKYSDGNDPSGSRAYIYGTEIDMAGFNPFAYAVHNENMPCAVCSVQKTSSIMIPARNNCYTDWNLEYNGYLMTNKNVHTSPYNHICMDMHPEFVHGGGTNNDEHVLYVVEAQCGSLPCPPYVHGRELACAVCSK